MLKINDYIYYDCFYYHNNINDYLNNYGNYLNHVNCATKLAKSDIYPEPISDTKIGLSCTSCKTNFPYLQHNTSLLCWQCEIIKE